MRARCGEPVPVEQAPGFVRLIVQRAERLDVGETAVRDHGELRVEGRELPSAVKLDADGMSQGHGFLLISEPHAPESRRSRSP